MIMLTIWKSKCIVINILEFKLQFESDHLLKLKLDLMNEYQYLLLILFASLISLRKLRNKYDHIFPPDSKQSDIYYFVASAMEGILKGINSTIFAYGQTGSGKTYTMFGKDWTEKVKALARKMHECIKTGEQYKGDEYLDDLGLIPRSIQEVFYYCASQSISSERIKIYLSFLQIYNEKIYDLLQDPDSKVPLQIREDKENGIYVEGLSEYQVSNSLDAYALLKRGEKNRIIRQTKSNIESSRSHSIFQLYIEYDDSQLQKTYKTKLNFCDLAGSEKLSFDDDLENDHLKELKSINLSLATLGKVIYCMAQGKWSYIPYRESKLTRFLQDSIGKNAQTWLIATVSPTVETFDESMNTLKFVDNAVKIKVKALNHSIEFKESEKIEELQKEITYLKELLNLKRIGNTEDVHRQLYILKKENSKLKKIASSSSPLPRNIYTASMNSAVSTARHHLIGLGPVESIETSREFKISPVDLTKDTRQNQRYQGNINGIKIDDKSKLNDQLDSFVFKNSKINSSSVPSSHTKKLSSDRRSSTDLQYAGAKILAGNYKYDPSSMHQADVIPLRIRTHNKTDNKTGSIVHSITQQELINKSIKGNKEATRRLDYLNDLEKRMKNGFKYNV